MFNNRFREKNNRFNNRFDMKRKPYKPFFESDDVNEDGDITDEIESQNELVQEAKRLSMKAGFKTLKEMDFYGYDMSPQTPYTDEPFIEDDPFISNEIDPFDSAGSNTNMFGEPTNFDIGMDDPFMSDEPFIEDDPFQSIYEKSKRKRFREEDEEIEDEEEVDDESEIDEELNESDEDEEIDDDEEEVDDEEESEIDEELNEMDNSETIEDGDIDEELDQIEESEVEDEDFTPLDDEELNESDDEDSDNEDYDDDEDLDKLDEKVYSRKSFV